MFLLGLRLAVQGGKETLARLMIMVIAVTIGTALLLSVLAMFRGYQIAEGKPCFTISDGGCEAVAAEDNKEAALALYRKDAYKGKVITRLDIAKLGNYDLTIPGISRMPQASEYYASPAMARLLAQAPADELGNRYPGKQVGIIGEAGLHGPDELVVVVGRNAADLASLPESKRITALAAQQASSSGAAFMRFITMLGAVALFFPMLILIGSAARVGAARREERYAAFRLVGATPRQISVIASVDAVLGSVLGVLAGIGLFFALQPFLADFAITGSRAFASDVNPSVWQFTLVMIGVPVSAGVASFFSLRRIKISPLGVSRKTTPPLPGPKGLLPLALGVVLFTGAVLIAPSDEPSFAAVPGFALMMIGLVTSGPWLTMRAVGVLARAARGASSLLAVRRLSDNPTAAFRSVSGLMLVVFTVSVVGFMAPAVLTQRLSANNDTLNSVLTVEFFPEKQLQSTEAKQLLRQLQTISGVETFPIYNDSSANQEDPIQGPPSQADSLAPPTPVVVGCDTLEQLKALGTCPASAEAMTVNFETYGDVILFHRVGSIITRNSKPQAINERTMALRGLLVRADSAATVEKARTVLTQEVVAPVGETLLTYGETRATTVATEAKLQAVISAALIVALITAGASVAVSVAGGLVERRRPFTLLRLSGAPLTTLYRVVFWEAAVPLISATLVAAVLGFSTAALVILEFAPESANAHLAIPDLPYMLALTAGPVVALIVACSSLPLLSRLTDPDTVRFE